METLLMDPLSALIGGVSSIFGGMMNTSSQQAINAANLQQQTWSAEGGYLPGLVQNANAAGLNPLAVLGSRGPNMAVQVGTQPGAGLQAFGQEIARADFEKRDVDIQAAKERIEHEAALTKQTNIDNAIRQKTLNDLNSGRTISGPQPAADTSVTGAAIQGGKDIGNWVSNNIPAIPFNSWADKVAPQIYQPPAWYYGKRIYDYYNR